MNLLKPIKEEEWIEKLRRHEFWIGAKRRYPQKLYSRLCKSYIGWWLHLRLHYPPFGRVFFLSRLPLLIDPLNCGGLWAHVRSFLFNFVVCDIWWATKHAVWKRFHRHEWEQQCAFTRAIIQAHEEGCADPMPTPPGFDNMNFRVVMIGERFFKRVAEILRKDSRT